LSRHFKYMACARIPEFESYDRQAVQSLWAMSGLPQQTPSGDDIAKRYPQRNGRAGRCARAESGHAAAAPPSSVMNSRRLMSNIRLTVEDFPSLRYVRSSPWRQLAGEGLTTSDDVQHGCNIQQTIAAFPVISRKRTYRGHGQSVEIARTGHSGRQLDHLVREPSAPTVAPWPHTSAG
jgi:hypothetical protein